MTDRPGISLRLASWNLHRCIGSDGVKSVQRCAEVLREIDADVVALQEVESRPRHELDALALLAHETGCHAIAGTTMKLGDNNYGNALLTRLPYTEVRRHNLSVAGREPRGALDVGFRIQDYRLQLVATHLGLRPAERRQQVQRLLPVFDTAAYDIVVLAGDFNEWWLWGRPLRQLHRLFPDTPHRLTWPASLPLFALDRIWVSPGPVMQRLTTHRSILAKQASDHLPLVADLHWPAPV